MGEESRIWWTTYACQLEDLGGQILQHSCNVDCSFCSDAHLVLGVLLEETLNATTGELIGGSVSAIMAVFCASDGS